MVHRDAAAVAAAITALQRDDADALRELLSSRRLDPNHKESQACQVATVISGQLAGAAPPQAMRSGEIWVT